jgi:steroid delta-isomerase-like uncharacterized protein
MSVGKALVQREVEMFNSGDLSIADEIYSDDYVGYDAAQPEPIRGIEGAKAEVAGYRAAFSDLSVTIDHQIADGDFVATRWTATGTHDGELFGIAPTGTTVTSEGITIVRIADGKIVEDHTQWDALGLMQAIGAVPAMA